MQPILISKCPDEFAASLTIIYNKSISEGCFPNPWKQTLVTLIFKLGLKHDVKNTGISQSFVYLV